METFVPTSSSIAATPSRAIADRLRPRLDGYLAVVGLAVGSAISAKAIKMAAAFRTTEGGVMVDAPIKWLRTLLDLAGHSILVRLIVFGVVWMAILRAVQPKRRWIVGVTPIALFVLWRIVTMVRYDRPFLSDSAFVEYFRTAAPRIASLYTADMQFIAIACAIAAAAIFLVSDRFLRSTRTVLLALAGLCAALIGLELAQFELTGMSGDAQLLLFAFDNAKQIMPIIATQISVASISILLIPLLAGAALSVLLPRVVRRIQNRYSGAPTVVLPATLFVPITFFLVSPKISDGRMIRVGHDPIIEFGKLVSRKGEREVNAAQRAAKLPLLFETKNLSFRPRRNAPRKNVVLILLESTRSSATSLYPPFLPTTPSMSWLAQRGAIVENMYVVEPRTTAAWIATMYGIWPSTDDVNEKWTRSEAGQSAAASLPRMLRQFGYATRFITPTFPSFMGDSVVLERIGFDAVIGGEQLATNLPKLNYLGLADEQIVKPALAWVDTNVTTGRPYFLTVMTSAAHHDYKQPPSWNKRQFDPKGSGLYNDYLNSVAYTDSSLVQGLLDGLSQRHLLDSTIVIVMGDHGQAFGDHQELVHGRQVYEETTRVPMVIYAPGRVAAGQRITGNRQTIDLLPTIADLLGVEIDGGHIPGASMLSDVASDREIWLSSAFFKSSLGLREGDRKVHFFFDRAPTQVFAIAADPNEERDLSGSMPSDELRAYEDRMLLWRARVIRALLAP